MPKTSLTNSLQRGFQILEAFTPAAPRMRLHEVVAKTGLPKVTVLRFLRTLTALNYISYDSNSKLYFLSPRVMSLGYTALSGLDVRKVALPFLENLSGEIGQNVNLGVIDGSEIIYVERIKKKQILNIDLHVGSRLKAYNSSIGQVILAFMDRGKCENLVKEFLLDPAIVHPEGPDGETLYENLEEVRRRGYALVDETYVSGVRAIAAPVFNHKGVVDAGINVPVFSHLVSLESLLQEYLPPLLETAGRVSAARGFSKSTEGLEHSISI